MENLKSFYTCHFCKKRSNEVKTLIVGPEGLGICNECVELCVEILDDKAKKEKDKSDDIGNEE